MRVIGDHRVIANGGAVLGIMPPYSVLLAPVVPMRGSTCSTLDAAVTSDGAAAAGPVAPIHGTNAASSPPAIRAASPLGADFARLASEVRAGALPGLSVYRLAITNASRVEIDRQRCQEREPEEIQKVLAAGPRSCRSTDRPPR